MKYVVLSAVCLASMLLAACDNTGEEAPVSSHRIVLSGNRSDTLSGQAVYGAIRYGTRAYTILQLQSPSSSEYILVELQSLTNEPFRAGTYAVTPFDTTRAGTPGIVGASVTFARENPWFRQWYYGTQGTLTVEALEDGVLTGSVRFDARDGADSLHVQGSFAALPGR